MSIETKDKSSGKSTFLFILFTAVIAVLVYSYKLSEICFWIDEIQTTTYIKNSFSEMIRLVVQKEACPPLYYIMLYIAHLLGADSELTLRIPSLILAFASILTIYFLAKELYGKKEGIISSILLSISPLFIICARDARLYSFFIFVNALLSLLFLRAVKYEKFKNWITYALVLAVSFYGHYFVAYIAISQFLYLCMSILLKEKDFPLINKNKKKVFINFFASGVIASLLFLPWIKYLLIQITRRHEFFLNLSAFQKIKNITSLTFLWLCGGEKSSEVLILLLVTAGIVFSLKRLNSLLFLLINIILPITLTLLYFVSINWVYQERYSSFLIVPLIVLASRGILKGSESIVGPLKSFLRVNTQKQVSYAFAAILLLMCFLAFLNINSNIIMLQKENWGETSKLINNLYSKNDLVTGLPPWTLWCLSKYGAFENKNDNENSRNKSYIYTVHPHGSSPPPVLKKLCNGDFELISTFPGWNPINVWRGNFAYTPIGWNIESNKSDNENISPFLISSTSGNYGVNLRFNFKNDIKNAYAESEEFDVNGLDSIIISGRSTVSYFPMTPAFEIHLFSSSGQLIRKQTVTPMALLTGDFTYFGWYREFIDLKEDASKGKLIFSLSGDLKKGEICRFVDIKIFGHTPKR